MLQAVLSNNPYIATTSEPWLLLPLLSIFNPKVNTAVYNGRSLKYALSDFLSKKNLNVEFENGIKELIFNMYSGYMSFSSKYFLDKTPRYYEIADEMVKYFPLSKIIVLKRNPLNVLHSIIRTWKVKSYLDLFFYHRDILEAPFKIQQFLESNQDNPNVLPVFYEDIVGQKSAEHFEKLFKWLELPFDINYLNYNENQKYLGKFGDPIGVQKKEYPQINKSENIDNDNLLWGNFIKGYYSYLGVDFLKSYMNHHFTPMEEKYNRTISSLRQVYYNLTGRKLKQLDFRQFKYGVDRGIYVKRQSEEDAPKLRVLWRHL